jgi:hypothetical protein
VISMFCAWIALDPLISAKVIDAMVKNERMNRLQATVL